MFRKNTVQQLNLDDPTINLPKYLRKNLEKSWATPFNKYIFSNINEERFEVLYSDEVSRPNSPVNVLVGLLILKENFSLPDEDLIGSLNFDMRFQFALGTTSYQKQPVSINTLYNFRTRILEYEKKTGRDLIKEEIEALAALIETEMKLDGKMLRMDSMMISSSCKKLSRIELVYTVNLKLIKELNKIDPKLVPEDLKCYLDEGHKNETIYRIRDKDAATKLEWLLGHSILLREVCSKYDTQIVECEAFKLLKRLLEEQVEVNEEGKTVPKDGKSLHSEILQNPSDPDATYREKYSGNVGYVANLVESFNEDSGVITHYDFKPNTYSDIKFCEELIDTLGEVSEVNVLVDGAYYSYEMDEKAKKQGIMLKPGQLVGKAPAQDKLPYSSFEVDEGTQKITLCPNKEVPQISYSSKNSYTAKFKDEQCDKCPLRNQCPAKKEKKGYSVKFSSKRYSNSKVREKLQTKEYIKLTNKRAGVEGIPSVIRRKYKVDAMPVRGLLRSKIMFSFKIGAYNFNKLLRYLKKKGIMNATSLLNNYIYTFIGKIIKLTENVNKSNNFTTLKMLVFGV